MLAANSGRLAGIGGTAVMTLLLCYTFAHRPQVGVWRNLAQLTSSSGDRIIVAAQHYDWIEGWAVNLFVVDSNENYYAFNMEIETSPWRRVELVETNAEVRVKRENQLVAVLLPAEQVIKNSMHNFFITNTAGKLPMRPVAKPWKWEFTYDHEPHSHLVE